MPERALVIVPTYNERDNIATLLNRILEQDPRLEVLIVDDGSPDGTGEIVDEIAAREPRVHVLHRAAEAGAGHGVHRRLPAGRSSATTSTSSRWTRTSRTIPSTSRSFSPPSRTPDLVLGSRYQRGTVTVVNWPISPAHPQLLPRTSTRGWVTGLPLDDSTGGFKCFRRSVLPGDRSRRREVERLRIPDRDELPCLAEALPNRRDPDRLRRPDRGPEQDVAEAIVREASGWSGGSGGGRLRARSDDPAGRPFLQMTGRGTTSSSSTRDRAGTTSSWSARPPCRRSAPAARGLEPTAWCVLAPSTLPGAAVADALLQRDGSRATFCGNATLCITRLAHLLGLSPNGSLALETDLGVIVTRMVAGRPEIDLPAVDEVIEQVPLALSAGERKIGFARVGVPHLVVLCESCDSVELQTRGAELRHSAWSADGANANFVSRRGAGWAMRTFRAGSGGRDAGVRHGSDRLGDPVGGLERCRIRVDRSRDQTVAARASAPRGRRNSWKPTLAGEGRIVFTGELAEWSPEPVRAEPSRIELASCGLVRLSRSRKLMRE